jgi:hypothetical protein
MPTVEIISTSKPHQSHIMAKQEEFIGAVLKRGGGVHLSTSLPPSSLFATSSAASLILVWGGGGVKKSLMALPALSIGCGSSVKIKGGGTSLREKQIWVYTSLLLLFIKKS